MSQRIDYLKSWLESSLKYPSQNLNPLTNDASFRRYFRINSPYGTQIVMDAPPEREKLYPFVDIARHLYEIGLHVPRVLAINEEQGFLLLSDLGNKLYLDQLKKVQQSGDERAADALYRDAFRALIQMQIHANPYSVPPYGAELLFQEMQLFPDWLLDRHLHEPLNEEDTDQLYACFALLSDAALSQPQVFVHRDYHSRNLMCCAPNPGIIDFQDAVCGAITYDLVSLLRDAYIVWPRAWVEKQVKIYASMARAEGLLDAWLSDEEFLRWFDWMGLQRHIKVAGIFARLYHRDGKVGYLKDIPLVLDYIEQVAERYEETAFLSSWVRWRIRLALNIRNGEIT